MSISWPNVPLSKCCDIVSGSTPRREVAAYWDGHIPWVTPKDISELNGTKILEDAPEYITDAGYKACSTRMLPQGSILFSSRAPIGLVAVAGREMCTNQGFKSLVPHENVDSDYLYHCMKWMAPKIAEMGNGATFKEVSKSTMDRIEIPLPPLNAQKRIAGILDKADAIRRKRAESLKLLDELLRATFLDMFGDPITNPKGWSTKGLLELFNITTGKLDSNAAVADGQYPFFTCARESFWIDNYAFDSEVLLLAGNNASADYSVKHYKGKFNAYQRTYVMSLKDQRNYYRLFKIALESRLGELKRRSKGTNTKYLTMGILKEIMLPVPDYNLQNQFDKIAQKVEAEWQKLNAYASESDTLFHSLVARAFKGEL